MQLSAVRPERRQEGDRRESHRRRRRLRTHFDHPKRRRPRRIQTRHLPAESSRPARNADADASTHVCDTSQMILNMKYFIAYWKYKDWRDTCDEKPPAYHAKAKILEDMIPGSELWLFTRITRNPKKKTIHVVERIKVKPNSPPSVKKKSKYVVVGDGLATTATIQATKKAIEDDDKKKCWLEVLSRMETIRGTSLKSKTAGIFAQRVQSPLEITPDSAILLLNEWEAP